MATPDYAKKPAPLLYYCDDFRDAFEDVQVEFHGSQPVVAFDRKHTSGRRFSPYDHLQEAFKCIDNLYDKVEELEGNLAEEVESSSCLTSQVEELEGRLRDTRDRRDRWVVSTRQLLQDAERSNTEDRLRELDYAVQAFHGCL